MVCLRLADNNVARLLTMVDARDVTVSLNLQNCELFYGLLPFCETLASL